MKQLSTKAWFAIMTVFAFASFISFCQVDSYQADKHGLNGFWIVVGIVTALGAIFGLSKVAKNSGSGDI